jgi:hypothetical protein
MNRFIVETHRMKTGHGTESSLHSISDAGGQESHHQACLRSIFRIQ